jgi:hypothetical protein
VPVTYRLHGQGTHIQPALGGSVDNTYRIQLRLFFFCKTHFWKKKEQECIKCTYDCHEFSQIEFQALMVKGPSGTSVNRTTDYSLVLWEVAEGLMPAIP